MLLILTGSLDGSADLIIHNASVPTFRFNFDLISDYSVILEPNFWAIENPAGNRIDSTVATRAWWWKVFSYGLDQDPMFRNEVKYLFQEIYAWFDRRKLIIGNPPDFENRFGKIAQLEAAKAEFPVVETSLRINSPFPKNLINNAVSKPLTASMDGNGRVRQTSDVSGFQLDPRYPWLVQTKVEALFDVTALVFGEGMQAFRRSRENLVGLDWRAEQFEQSESWEEIEIPSKYREGISKFMKRARTNWGRLDFLQLADQSWVFLEFNANGQWAFLERSCPTGLPKRVADFLCAGVTTGLG